MHPDVTEAIQQIDAALFNGDTFDDDPDARAELTEYLARWFGHLAQDAPQGSQIQRMSLGGNAYIAEAEARDAARELGNRMAASPGVLRAELSGAYIHGAVSTLFGNGLGRYTVVYTVKLHTLLFHHTAHVQAQCSASAVARCQADVLPGAEYKTVVVVPGHVPIEVAGDHVLHHVFEAGEKDQ